MSRAKRSVYRYADCYSVTANIAGSDGKFAFAGKYGFHTYDESTGSVETLREIWSAEERASGNAERFRFNDGACDSRGRFWACTMNDPLVVGGDNLGPEGQWI